MSRHTLNRAGYVREMQRGCTPAEIQSGIVSFPELAYPKTTEQASVELRYRGLDFYSDTLERMTDRVKVERDASGELLWTAEAIDHTAELAAEWGWLTPAAQVCFSFNIDMSQERDALAAAAESNPDIGWNGDAYEVVIRPGNPATITYRRPAGK